MFKYKKCIKLMSDNLKYEANMSKGSKLHHLILNCLIFDIMGG